MMAATKTYLLKDKLLEDRGEKKTLTKMFVQGGSAGVPPTTSVTDYLNQLQG